jgi:hypothetical protein
MISSMTLRVFARSGRGGDLAQSLLEYFGWLSALDQVAIVDDHGRYGVDAMLLVETLALAHFLGIFVR